MKHQNVQSCGHLGLRSFSNCHTVCPLTQRRGATIPQAPPWGQHQVRAFCLCARWPWGGVNGVPNSWLLTCLAIGLLILLSVSHSSRAPPPTTGTRKPCAPTARALGSHWAQRLPQGESWPLGAAGPTGQEAPSACPPSSPSQQHAHVCPTANIINGLVTWEQCLLAAHESRGSLVHLVTEPQVLPSLSSCGVN